MTHNKPLYDGQVMSSLFYQGGHTDVWDIWERMGQAILLRAIDDLTEKRFWRVPAQEWLRSSDASELAELLDFSEGLEKYLLEQKMVLPLFLAVDNELEQGPIFIAADVLSDGALKPIFENYGQMDSSDNRV